MRRERVLLIRLSAMGDVVQSLGAAVALAAARPDLEICFVTQKTHASLLRGLPFASVIEHDRKAGVAGFLRTSRALRSLRADLAIDLQGNGKSALLARCSGCRERLGAAGPWRQEPWSRWFLNRTVTVQGPRHPALVAARLVKEIAADAVVGPSRLHAEEPEIDAERRALRSIGLDPEAPFRVVLLGRPTDNRSQRPAAVAREVGQSPIPSVLLAGPAESSAVPPEGVPVLRHGPGEPRRLVALGALGARAAGGVVGGDNGALHVLAASGARTIALFGPQDAARTAPAEASALQRPDAPPCVPCERRRCRRAGGPICMDFTSLEGNPWGSRGA
ncbi:MAG: hypothetical protein Fur0037_22300 [Planctomycetota bacterium]